MFNLSKITALEGHEITDFERDLAKNLLAIENENQAQTHLASLFFNSAERHTFTAADGSKGMYTLIRCPYRSLHALRKSADFLIPELEKRFSMPVIMVCRRNIISPNAIHHPTQKRPRSRTLKAVHQATLEDIVAPSHITGRQIRVSVDGSRHEKIFLQPLDRALMEPRLEAMASAYEKLTTHRVHFEFSKLTAYQQQKQQGQKKKNN